MNAERLLAHYERIADAPNAVARLRRFILDLAVRGKLMPQDPKDEPASELLKKIAAAKARLARTGRDVFDEGDLVGGFRFEVPRLWCWSEIETVAYVEMGQSPPSDHYNQRGDGIAFFQGKADFGARNPTPRYWCTQPTKFAEAGDILISVRAPVVPTNVASQRCCIGRGLAALRPYEGLDRDFLLLSLRAFEGDLASLGFGTTFVAINKKHLTMFPIPLPPLVEQKRIVAKVDELMALCDQLDKARAEREATRDRLAAALLGRLNAPDPETFHDDARFALSALPSMTARPDQVKQLRQTILSLAVRGKLVLQDPNCEPVLSIIEAIRAEGSPLPTSGKASKAAKASATVDIAGVPFTPPIGWAWQRIDALVRSVKHDIRTGPFGSSLHKADHRQHGVPVWGIESISKAGVFIARNKIFVTPQKARELSSFSVKFAGVAESFQ